MPGKSTQRKPTKQSGMTVMFAKDEKQLIRRAAVETEVRSAGQFIREAALKAARETLAA